MRRVHERGAGRRAAVLLGVAAKAIWLGAAYAVGRHQFDKPIGSFQAVKHRLADALVALEFARPVAYAAAQTLSAKPNECALDVSMAKAFVSDAGRREVGHRHTVLSFRQKARLIAHPLSGPPTIAATASCCPFRRQLARCGFRNERAVRP